ncbi:uncharacterized protein LOC133735609 [Rosa rugosa]|uniref:uncharacterized protein LOC133735609 n=1 Tax=Rosa rugosa TaxID=74645 RepID=UPI002B40F24C|nr:uncharacterized protein LOC133735609 [Rosa rugosa]
MDQSGSVPSGRKAKDVKVPDQSGSGNPPRRKANEVKDQSRSGIPSGRKAKKDVKDPDQSGSGNPPGRKANVVKDQSGSVPSGRKAKDVEVTLTRVDMEIPQEGKPMRLRTRVDLEFPQEGRPRRMLRILTRVDLEIPQEGKPMWLSFFVFGSNKINISFFGYFPRMTKM